MNIKLIEICSFSLVQLNRGEDLHVNPGKAQAWQGVKMSTEFSANFWEGVKRVFWNAATIFTNLFTCTDPKGGWVLVEESMPGALQNFSLTKDKSINILKSNWVASSSNIDLKTKFAGYSGLFSNTGLAMINASLKADATKGRILFNTNHGIIRRIDIASDSGPVTVDNDSIIAYTDGLRPSFRHAGEGVKSFFFGKENIVCDFNGRGSIFISSVPQVERKPLRVHHHHHEKNLTKSHESKHFI